MNAATGIFMNIIDPGMNTGLAGSDACPENAAGAIAIFGEPGTHTEGHD